MVILVLGDFGLGCARFVLRFGFVADLGCLCGAVGVCVVVLALLCVS